MNKILKSAFVALTAMVGLAMTSCTEEYSYDAVAATGEQVYFDKALTKVNLSQEATSFQVTIHRINTGSELTVNVKSTDESNLFTIPATATFAADATEAPLTIGYDPTKFAYDDFKTISLALTDSINTTPYGLSAVTFTAGVPAPFTSLGLGSFVDNYYFEKSANVEILQKDTDPNVFRIVAPYKTITGGGSDYMEITVLQPGQTLFDVPITQKDLVFWEDFNSGYHHPSYDKDIMIYHPATFSKLRTESNWIKSCVLQYQEDGKPGLIQLAPYYYMDGLGGWSAITEDKAITITFPSFVPADYSAEMEMKGVLTDLKGVVYANADLTLGADAFEVKGVVRPSDDDALAVADAIAAGELTDGVVDVKAGNIQVPISDDMTGKLQLIVVVLADGKVKTVINEEFEYYGGGASPWKSLGVGYYTDDVLYSTFSEEGLPYTYEVEIEEHSETPGLYRLKAPYSIFAEWWGEGKGDADILVHAEDTNGVYILEQSIGLTANGNDMTMVTYGGDAVGYYETQGYPAEAIIAQRPQWFGKLADGVISFPSFPATDEDGNPITDEGGNPVNYQGYLVCDGLNRNWYAGLNGKMEIYLPGAAPAEESKAKRAAAASKFLRRLKGSSYYGNGVKTTKRQMRMHHFIPEQMVR